MRVEVRQEEGEVRVIVRGGVVYDATAALERAVRDAMRRAAARVVVDLAECPELSSMAVGLLVGFKIEATLGGRDLRVSHPNDRIRRLLEIAGAADALLDGRSGPSAPGAEPCPGTPS